MLQTILGDTNARVSGSPSVAHIGLGEFAAVWCSGYGTAQGTDWRIYLAGFSFQQVQPGQWGLGCINDQCTTTVVEIGVSPTTNAVATVAALNEDALLVAYSPNPGDNVPRVELEPWSLSGPTKLGAGLTIGLDTSEGKPHPEYIAAARLQMNSVLVVAGPSSGTDSDVYYWVVDFDPASSTLAITDEGKLNQTISPPMEVGATAPRVSANMCCQAPATVYWLEELGDEGNVQLRPVVLVFGN